MAPAPGFLSGILAEQISTPCGGALILDVHDPLVRTLRPVWSEREQADAVLFVCARGQMTTEGILGKMYLIPDQPTPPTLARHWHDRLKQPVAIRSAGLVSLIGVRFWESPDSWSAYGPAFGSGAEDQDRQAMW
jgi:hypothetical protein